MCRRLALISEIVRRADKSIAEVPRPNAIDDDSSRERILLGRGQPFGERGATLVCRDRGWGEAWVVHLCAAPTGQSRDAKGGGKTRRDYLARFAQFAAAQQPHFHRRFGMQQSKPSLLFGLQCASWIVLQFLRQR